MYMPMLHMYMPMLHVHARLETHAYVTCACVRNACPCYMCMPMLHVHVRLETHHAHVTYTCINTCIIVFSDNSHQDGILEIPKMVPSRTAFQDSPQALWF